MLDRIVGLTGLMLVAFGAALININRIMADTRLQYVALALIAVLGSIAAGCIILMSEKLKNTSLVRFFHKVKTLQKLHEAVAIYKEHKLIILKTRILIHFIIYSPLIMRFGSPDRRTYATLAVGIGSSVK